MDDDDEKLTKDLLARIERERAETDAKYYQDIANLDKEELDMQKRIGVGFGVSNYINQKRDEIKKEHTDKIAYDAKNHAKFLDQLADGTYVPPPLDQEKEDKMLEAERTWRGLVTVSDGRVPDGHIREFEKKYGKDIFFQMDRRADIVKQQKAAEQKLEQERREAAQKLEEEKKLAQWKERQQEKIRKQREVADRYRENRQNVQENELGF